MFAWEVIQSLLFIAVITAGIVAYAVVVGRSKDTDAVRETYRKTA